jgi:hypothetical protein
VGFAALSTREKIEELTRRYQAHLIDAAELHRLRVELLEEPVTAP